MVETTIAKKIIICAVIACVICVHMPVINAGEVDILVQKLVDKGILSPVEAQTILDETKIGVKEEIANVESYGSPTWAQRIALKGDLRTRYQYSNTDGNDPEVRHRGRLRLRLGAIAKVNEQLEVGFGFATGENSDPRSTNLTLRNDFSKEGIYLDYAYAKYMPFDWAEVIGGKMKNPLWTPSDLLWDSDINPEGAALNLNIDVNENIKAFMNNAFFIMDESSSNNNEPTMFVFQPGVEMVVDNLEFKTAGTLYATNDAKGYAQDWSAGSNNKGNYNWICLAGGAELGMNFDKEGLIPYAGIFGEGVLNIDSEDPGFLFGAKIGDKKVKTFGDWQLKGSYRYLERNSWIDSYPDSDAWGGATDVKGLEGILEMGLMDNVILSLDYYRMAAIQDGAKEDIFQVDVSYKF
ncbi:MAG: putative porin [Candidatus Omnitrophica bacterium]|nr:putative porin [Candidatus Omnitrophota bacterium]